MGPKSAFQFLKDEFSLKFKEKIRKVPCLQVERLLQRSPNYSSFISNTCHDNSPKFDE